jgi:hypothetical protein
MDKLRAQFRGGTRGPAPTPAPAPAPAASATTPAQAGAATPAPNSPATSPPATQPTQPEGERREAGSRRGGGGGGGFFGGGSRGRLQFSLTDTITFADKVTIAPGLDLDYLHGDASGQGGGTPRHRIEAQAGWSNNGLGARLSANWRSATRVNTLTGDDLHFSPLSTFDLRLFANPGDIPEVTLKHPWLRGTQFRLEVDNLFDARPRVRDAAGVVPLNYQGNVLDPIGRTIRISIRKLFLPSPSWFRAQREREQQQSQ